MRDYATELPVILEMDLYKAGWNGALSPYPGETTFQVALRSLRKSLVKKYSDETNQKADAAALKLFLSINERCKGFTNTGASQLTEIDAIALGEAKEWIHRFCYPYGQEGDALLNTSSVASNFGVGSGANIGSKGTSFLSKVGLSSMAATDPSLQILYRDAISFDPLWSDVETIRREFRKDEIVRGSRLSFVPKTTEISRTICTEPICNMLWQKGIGAVLEKRLRQVCGIDLSRQPDLNRNLAWRGSVDGRYGTIDLSSASDSMSISVVKEFFPSNFVSWLMRTRSPLAILPDGQEVELHMVSSMGNAFTFPLQTIFFTSLVYGVYRARGIKFCRPNPFSLGNFAVFGDDIIVVEEAYDQLCRLLNVCGFSVNVDKSFNKGLFRESCGMDFQSGQNVRGVYIKHLADDCDRYSAINRLNNWSARWGVPLPRTVGYLRSGLRTLYVPMDEADTAGIKAPLICLDNKRIPKNGVFSYRMRDVRMKSTDLREVECKPPEIEGWFNNHPAVLLAALAGTLRAGQIVFRQYRRSTRLRVKRSPCWDYVPPAYRVSGAFVHDWKVVYGTNLTY